MTLQDTLTGGCFCGAVRYALDGALGRAQSCHCSQCRKAFNGASSAMAGIGEATFRWTQGEDNLTTYAGQHGYGIQFCQTCGSTLCGVFEGRVMGVTLGCVDGDPGVSIGRHIYVGSKAPWDIVADGVPHFDEAAD